LILSPNIRVTRSNGMAMIRNIWASFEKYLYGIRWIIYIMIRPVKRKIACFAMKWDGLVPGFLKTRIPDEL
jgi:hypothetical protein